MKVTVCEFRDDLEGMEADWEGLVQHVHENGSDLVLLPEMPFAPWPAYTNQVDAQIWEQAVQAHDEWIGRLDELKTALVLGSRPILEEGIGFNEAFVWEDGKGAAPSHRKYYLPDEEGFWEATWYQRGEKVFESVPSSRGLLGFMVCTEIWYTEHARDYARQGVELLVCPRATELSTVDKWVAGGRAAAVMSGSYCLSSNRQGENNGVFWGGRGWVIDPDGEVLGVTSSENPYITREVDLSKSAAAKQTYPRYVLE